MMATVTSLSGNNNVLEGHYDELHGIIRLDDGTLKTFSIQRGSSDTAVFDGIVSAIEDESSPEYLADLILNATAAASIVEEKISGHLESLGLNDRLTRCGERIFMDGEPIDQVLEREILRILHTEADNDPDGSDRNWTALLRFVNDLYSNNTKYVRDQLFSWLKSNFEDDSTNGFTLLDDGRVVGYKGVQDMDGVPFSKRSGLGLVKEKGEKEFREVNGYIPNKIGSIIAMPKSKVTDDPNNGCAPGLHIGTWDYANSWGNGYVLTVAFSAGDVVSVPVDSAYQKLRVCKYEVLNVTRNPAQDISLNYDDDYEDDYEDEDDED
jgi:hypothetical protein